MVSEEFTTDAFGTPTRILGRHLLNQRDKFLGERRPTWAGVTLEPPEESEPLAMPMQKGLGFKDQEGFIPRGKLAVEEQEGETVSAS
jgi:hypothetical protein